MSFMLVAGKIFICIDCQKSVCVEYEGGSSLTQIGDSAIDDQIELWNDFDQPNDDPNNEGFYLYDLGICDKCYEHRFDSDERRRYADICGMISHLEERRAQSIETIASMMEMAVHEVASSLTLEDISIAVGRPVDPALGDNHATESKKKRMITGFAQHYLNRIEPYIEKKIFADGSIRKALKQYREDIKPVRKQLSSLLVLTQGRAVFQKHTNAVENLNAHILTESTIRRPVKNAPDEIFNFLVELDVPDLMISFAIFPNDSDITRNASIDNRLIRTILTRLTMPEDVH